MGLPFTEEENPYQNFGLLDSGSAIKSTRRQVTSCSSLDDKETCVEMVVKVAQYSHCRKTLKDKLTERADESMESGSVHVSSFDSKSLCHEKEVTERQ